MAKDNEKALKLFKKESQPTNFQQSFEVKEASKSRNFREEFVAAPLSREEDLEIQHILYDESAANIASEALVSSDYKDLVDITTQIRAIERQGVLLHGERIHKARDILKKYKDGAFTRWLEVAYGNRQTPYRILQYFEFFKTLGEKDRELMQSMPRRAAYVLASRDGDKQKKVEIIKEYHARSHEDIIQAVQEVFPLSTKDRRKGKDNDVMLVESIRATLIKIKKKSHLSSSAFEKLQELRELMDEICMQNK